MSDFAQGQHISHPRFGAGVVELDKVETALVRFDHGIEECPKSLLTTQRDLHSSIINGEFDPPVETITRVQAEAIVSINDSWGIFSRSRIALLPHQLWVCHRVTKSWPFSWLVADDVGLGKTIEAGLILWPLLAKGLVNRLLIICPSSLVGQWQYRLREMFDIRLFQYLPKLDTPKSDFWNSYPQIVASLQTMRDDHNGRHQRLFAAEPWDLLIVDEAHHLNIHDDLGATKGYQLIEQLITENHVKSKLFFTGTPHRGKNYGFFGLLQLLREDLFSPKSSPMEQMPHLPQVLLRNNKQNVTDMDGNPLFQPVTVKSQTYAYSQEEAAFYSLLTDFIATGKAYASSLKSQRDQQAVMLVLIAMQKLASSSVAAIRKALKGRLERIRRKENAIQTESTRIKHIRELIQHLGADDQPELLDELQTREEAMTEEAVELQLMKNETSRIELLIEAADIVEHETKILKILDIIKSEYTDRKVLFFTEYKATQALLMSALIQEFDNDCVTFINGDNRIEGVIDGSGAKKVISTQRADAADAFNEGEVRFLVSTEAAGEGIDLQASCYTLIHVDLPWNPMRLHQRVGRLNRYGQRYPVEAVTLRNPDTVESLIWDKLNGKIEKIMAALSSAMDEPEDLLQLVLGMASPSMFTEIFSEASIVPKDSLSQWFDEKTKTFGGRDAIETVTTLVGNSTRFDYKNLPEIPRKDLKDLKHFFELMLKVNKRMIKREGESISFKTPEDWLKDPGVKRRYENLVFSRNVKGRDASLRIIGIGHRAFDRAIDQARRQPAMLSSLQGLEFPIAVFKVFDRVTGKSENVKQLVYAVEKGCDHALKVLKDWEMLDLANRASSPKDDGGKGLLHTDGLLEFLEDAEKALMRYLETGNHPFEYPSIEKVALFCHDQ